VVFVVFFFSLSDFSTTSSTFLVFLFVSSLLSFTLLVFSPFTSLSIFSSSFSFCEIFEASSSLGKSFGGSCKAFKDNQILFFSGSKLIIFAAISSPTFI
jgi:hypothetical protein